MLLGPAHYWAVGGGEGANRQINKYEVSHDKFYDENRKGRNTAI